MKKYIVIPAALLIYLGAMAYFFPPEKTGLGHTQYFTIIGVSLIIIIAAAFFLKKKDKNAQKYKDSNKKN